MNALPSELARLFHVATPATQQGHDTSQPLTTADGQVRCAVLELARPADWDALGAVWHGVQVDLELPAPAIAVNGTDGYQLWFSWQQPLPAEEAAHFLQLLCQRYLAAVDPQRLRCYPGAEPMFPLQVPALQVPDAHGHGAQWSAFLASDLAGVFADEPWLDRHPGQDAQAQLLARLSSMPAQDYAKALQRLQPVVSNASPVSLIDPSAASALAHSPSPQSPAMSAATASPHANYPTETPATFLQAVMQDPAAPLALRLQAASALLHGAAAPRG